MKIGDNWVFWSHFDAQRTKDAHGDVQTLVTSIVNLTAPAGSNDWDQIQMMSSNAQPPFPIKSVSERLKGDGWIRGRVFFGIAGDQIQRVMTRYPTLRWWLEADGLVIDEPPGELGHIGSFDRMAGRQVAEHWCDDGLSEDHLLGIARHLDTEGFKLKEELQPAQWKPIAEHNQKFSRSAIMTFEAAARNKRFVRAVGRRLYLARDRYRKALSPLKPILL